MIFHSVIISCDLFDSFKEFEFQPLEFHFANPNDISYLAAFGVPDWGGAGHYHGDIDLHINADRSGTAIISPTYGTVKSVTYNTMTNSTPPNLLLVKVEIYVNKEYTIWLGFEPGDTIGFLDTQLKAIKVSEGQEVKPGDIIGNLQVGSSGFAILAISIIQNDNLYLCPYHNSSANARVIYDRLAATIPATLVDGKICGRETVPYP
jgi:hypothetical protein